MLARSLCLAVLLLLPGLAQAELKSEAPPPACVPKDWDQAKEWRDSIKQTPPANAQNWREETARIGKSQEVWRYLDRLYLAADGGKVVTFADCPYSDGLRLHLYERYDEVGRFHVVRTVYYEDHAVTLVMKKTGALYNLPAAPIWSPDRARFAYGVCDLMNGKDDIAIVRPAGDGLTAEVEDHMPCGMGNCQLVWEDARTLSATCPKVGEKGTERKVMRFTLRGDSKWQSTTGAR